MEPTQPHLYSSARSSLHGLEALWNMVRVEADSAEEISDAVLEALERAAQACAYAARPTREEQVQDLRMLIPTNAERHEALSIASSALVVAQERIKALSRLAGEMATVIAAVERLEAWGITPRPPVS